MPSLGLAKNLTLTCRMPLSQFQMLRADHREPADHQHSTVRGQGSDDMMQARRVIMSFNRTASKISGHMHVDCIRRWKNRHSRNGHSDS